MRKKKNYWNKLNSFETALMFDNKRDFKKKFIAAYELLRKNGWLDNACMHMKNPSKKWTFEKCKNEAFKYKTKGDFKKNCSWGYIVAKKNNWFDDITSHMIKYKHAKLIKWTFDKCKEEALKYTKRIDFSKNSSKAYSACIRNGWINEVCKHMSAPHSSNLKWSKEKCHEIALKYLNRKEFSKFDYCAYSSALYNGWLDDICGHMIRFGDRKHKCIYSYEFSDNHVYIGLTYNINVRDKSRRYEKNDAVFEYIKKTKLTPILKQLTDYLPVNEATVLEGEYLNKYINDGWITLNRGKTGGIGGYNSVWNFNRVKAIALQYDSIEELKKCDIFIYEIINKRGWGENIFKNEF